MDQSEIEKQVKEICAVWSNDNVFIEKLSVSKPEVICAVIPRLASTGSTVAMMDARRDTCMAILNEKLTKNLISTMIQLDKAAKFLAWVGIFVGAVIGIAQILLPIIWHTTK